MRTSCPRRSSSRPTVTLGSISPRLPQHASTNFIADPSLSVVVRVGDVRGIGHYPWFFGCRLGVRQLASADRSPLVPTAAAFVGGGDWYRSTVLWDASEICHAARGSQHQVSRRRSRRTRAAAALTAATSAIPPVSATTRSSCWSHAWACDRSRRRGCGRMTSTGAPGGASCAARRPARTGYRCPPMSGRR
jgi:hypothetical protein